MIWNKIQHFTQEQFKKLQNQQLANQHQQFNSGLPNPGSLGLLGSNTYNSGSYHEADYLPPINSPEGLLGKPAYPIKKKECFDKDCYILTMSDGSRVYVDHFGREIKFKAELESSNIEWLDSRIREICVKL